MAIFGTPMNVYFLKCNLEFNNDPYMVFKALKFTEQFSTEQRVKFIVLIDLVGKLIKPDNLNE